MGDGTCIFWRKRFNFTFAHQPSIVRIVRLMLWGFPFLKFWLSSFVVVVVVVVVVVFVVIVVVFCCCCCYFGAMSFRPIIN